MNDLIEEVKQDCQHQGWGRKKWWANQLGIPPLTLSHWFAGRQLPNGDHSLKIQDIFNCFEQDQKAVRWEKALWECYYGQKQLSVYFLSDILLTILSKTELSSRTIALLSLMISKIKLDFLFLTHPKMRNRLGWLLEISGRKAPFFPNQTILQQDLLENSNRSERIKKYLRSFQTSTGKKWKIYDCNIHEIRESLPWPQKWTELDYPSSVVSNLKLNRISTEDFLKKLARLEPKDFEDIFSLYDLKLLDFKKILLRLNENILELKNLDYRNNVKLFFAEVFKKKVIFKNGRANFN